MVLYEKTNLSETLKKLRVQQKISQAELAEKMKCSRHEIVNIESGKRIPNYKALCRWIRACDAELVLWIKKKIVTQIPIDNPAE